MAFYDFISDENYFRRIFGYEPEYYFPEILQKFYDTGICQKSDKEYIMNVYKQLMTKRIILLSMFYNTKLNGSKILYEC